MTAFWMGIVALFTGIGVYRSCTAHRDILIGALAIDALMAFVMIFGLTYTGAVR